MDKTISGLSALISAAFLFSATAHASDGHPQIIKQVTDRGLKVVSSFKSVDGMTGYVLDSNGSPVTLYVTRNGEHAFVGTLIDENGTNLSAPKVQELFIDAKNREAWSKLENSHWIQDGDPNAETVVYAFVDPNCPYCHRFRTAALRWINEGKVQIRHIVVGVLASDSVAKASTILGSNKPHGAYIKNFETFRSGGIVPVHEAWERGKAQVEANNRLMSDLGVSATPGIYYKDGNGNVRMRLGLPPESELNRIMNP
ncbi:thiol:disulfide interchange protein DsbG [Marinobacter adhaerens]|jgi:thiol:disulfide interchange protein DsbG|uniref:thiol:disulfide interchange protein DsbG n=1 Tax=Marinobacter adhaerens TaxID=1033846 RepID=UPI001E32B210|nr:thiol:disulfide interchange protein DsbG [Marinobacter adhaerens]MCD1647323.1 thiol:disulfide interchange protein DsbG [Marinobacter adhaerens]